ncbi:MAG: LuxR C-terminal-related transcriptional regulator, partial [Stenotrophobium sp.]
ITVERWYVHLPLEEIEQRPDLAIKIAYALVFLRRDQKLRPILDILKKLKSTGDIRRTTDPNVVCSMAAIEADDIAGAFAYIENVNLREQDDEGFSGFELGAGANLAAYFAVAKGDHEAARELQSLARAHNERSGATFSGGYTFGITGINLMAQGQLGQALERFRTGMAEQRFYLDKSFASAALVSCYILALYEANEIDEAEALFLQFHETIAESVLLDFLAVAYISMSRIHVARGRPGKSLEILEEAENIGHTSRWPRLIRIINWERVRRALLRGELGRAESIAERMPQQECSGLPQDWILFSEEVSGDAIGAIRMAIHKSQPDQALQLIARELAVARSQGRIRRQIKLLILDAQAQKSKGIDNAAHRSLREALQLAEPGKFIRTFLEEGEGMISLLQEEYQTLAPGMEKFGDADFGISTRFIETLLGAGGVNLQNAPSQASLQSSDTLTEALTDREKKILIYLSNGVSNKEMARKIFVSENTVKFHLKNIYSKLSVSSRLQAINAARQMGIVP